MLNTRTSMESSATHTTTQTLDTAGREDADVHSSTPEYARRFGGPTGAWMLSVQRAILMEMLPTATTESVLDIGGGHGQIALPLYESGRGVTVLASSPDCASLLAEYIESGAIAFRVGNLIELPFDEKSFDIVVSFRLMSHCTAWRTLIAEMCRVAESHVIFDYPIWCSSNFFTPMLFKIKRLIEGNTRRYRIFTTKELVREFALHGFKCSALKKQFFFPMGLHRALRSARISAALETIAGMLGLTRLFGSPVIACFTRSSRDS
jgi:2-polyprenyl-3-methyl-5-hydroxy-6-metoxy-1,4-benzoquinol methylase